MCSQCVLRGLDTLARFQGKQLLSLSVCDPSHKTLSEKGSTQKVKNLLPFLKGR